VSPDRVPVIGVIARQDVSAVWQGYRLFGQGYDYCRSVALAGGAPLIIPLELGPDAWRSAYERLDGILFPGGVDVNPCHYGEQPHPHLGNVDDALDEAELLLARWALAELRPVFAICRGIQLVNVAAGGTLYQDLPSQTAGSLCHACYPPEYPRDSRAHTVDVVPNTRLSAILGEGELWTNSRHHQAVKDLAPGFVVSARASDGVIEAIERPDAQFLIGVQWHPENLAAADPRMMGLFRSFIQACESQASGALVVQSRALRAM
jgi:putative glutamine amidotransferase